MTGPDGGNRRVDYLPLSQIRRAARNPKQHAGDAIRASIERFGLAELPLLDERTGRLVAGHGRLAQAEVMHAAGQAPPDGVTVNRAGEWLLPVIRGWSSRSDAEASAYLVASNQLTIAGGWDETALAGVLAGLADVDVELLRLTAFDEDDLARLTALLDAPDLDGFKPAGAAGPARQGDEEDFAHCPACGLDFAVPDDPT